MYKKLYKFELVSIIKIGLHVLFHMYKKLYKF
jgi:hypothetical protein